MRRILAIAFTLICCSLSAQRRAPFELSTRWDSKGGGIIEVSRFDGGRYSAVLEFSDLVNLSVTRFQRAIISSRSTLATLKPIDPSKTSNFQFRYLYVPGNVNPRRVDPAFVYRLPFGVTANRMAIEAVNVIETYWGVDEQSVDFKSFRFTMNRADTVYAARRGVVINVMDIHLPVTGMGEVDMSTEHNLIEVEHADGTIAQYSVLEKGSITVKPGDTVYPDTPIALAGTLDGESYVMGFALYYRTDNFNNIRSLYDYSITNHYLDPVLATSEGETTLTHGVVYTPVAPEELITREMTRRELRTRP